MAPPFPPFSSARAFSSLLILHCLRRWHIKPPPPPLHTPLPQSSSVSGRPSLLGRPPSPPHHIIPTYYARTPHTRTATNQIQPEILTPISLHSTTSCLPPPAQRCRPHRLARCVRRALPPGAAPPKGRRQPRLLYLFTALSTLFSQPSLQAGACVLSVVRMITAHPSSLPVMCLLCASFARAALFCFDANPRLCGGPSFPRSPRARRPAAPVFAKTHPFHRVLRFIQLCPPPTTPPPPTDWTRARAGARSALQKRAPAPASQSLLLPSSSFFCAPARSPLLLRL